MAGPVSMEQSNTDNRRRRSRISPRNWRVPTRLTALIVAPTIVAVLLAGVRVVGSIDSLTAYQRTRSAAEYSVHLRDLAEQLALERDLFVWGGNSKRKFDIDGETEVTRAQQRAAVDPLIQQVKADLKNINTDYGTRAVEQAQQLTSRISSLAGIRENGAPEDYSAVIANILRLHDELGNNDDNAAIVGNVRALSALAHAKEEAALQRATLTRELLERNQTFTTFELQDFLASQSRQQSYLATFYTEAPATEASRLVTLFGDRDVVNSELTKSWALTLGLQNQSLSRYRGRDRTAQQWFQNSTKAIEQMAAVEGRVSELVQSRARDLQSAEQRNALIAGGLILALLVLVLATTVLIARSMVRPLRRLRAEALDNRRAEAAGDRPADARVRGPRARVPRAADRGRQQRRDRRGGAGLRRGPHAGRASGRGGVPPARQRQLDVREPFPPYADTGGAADLADRRPGAGRGGRPASGRPVQAGPPGHAHAPQQ